MRYESAPNLDSRNGEKLARLGPRLRQSLLPLPHNNGHGDRDDRDDRDDQDDLKEQDNDQDYQDIKYQHSVTFCSPVKITKRGLSGL